MLIKRIHIHNYKTYLDLDLDLSVEPDKPIVLVGGGNGGAKPLCLKRFAELFMA